MDPEMSLCNPHLFPYDKTHHPENVLPQPPVLSVANNMLEDTWRQFKINENHVALMQWDGWKVNPLKSISKPHLHWHHFYKILSHYGDFTLDSSMFYSQTFFSPQNTNSCWTSGSDWLSVCLQDNWSKISGHLPVDIQKRNVYQWTAGTWFPFCSGNISLAGSENGGRGSKNLGGP